MEIDKQFVIAVVLSFSLYVFFVPLFLLNIIKLKAFLYMLLLGIIMVPLSAGKEAAIYNITFMQALTFNFDGSSRGMLASYCVLLLGLALTLTAIVKSALTRQSSSPAKNAGLDRP